MFGIGKKSRLDKELKELHACLTRQVIGFAARVSEEFGRSTWKDERRSYDLLISLGGPPTTTRSPLNQMVLAIEGLCFFLHALDRISFETGGEQLRETVLDCSARKTARLFTELLGKCSKEFNDPSTASGVIGLINERNSEYGQAPSLLGPAANDRSSALWKAARIISESADYPKNLLLVLIIQTFLIEGLLGMDLPNRLRRIGTLL